MSKGCSDYFAGVDGMIRAEAIQKYQIDRKFELLYELLREDDTAHAQKLTRSIQDDIGNLG